MTPEIWRSSTPLAIPTRIARTSAPPTSGLPPSPSDCSRPAGSAAIAMHPVPEKIPGKSKHKDDPAMAIAFDSEPPPALQGAKYVPLTFAGAARPRIRRRAECAASGPMTGGTNLQGTRRRCGWGHEHIHPRQPQIGRSSSSIARHSTPGVYAERDPPGQRDD